jgi:hypothetical protein
LRNARRLFAQAEQDEASERWGEAADKLEQVLAIKETAGVRFHLANCEEHLGELLKGRDNYERARSLAQEAKIDDVLSMVRDRLDALRPRIPTVVLTFQPHLQPQEALDITIDSALADQKQAAEGIALDPGLHRILVQLNGNPVMDRSVLFREGAVQTLLVELPAPKTPVVPTSSAPIATASSGGEPPKASSIPPLAWLSFGTAAALGVGGFLAYQHAGSVASDSSATCAQSLSCDPQRSKVVRGWDWAALGMWVGAAGAVGLGTTLSLSSTNKDSRATSVGIGPGRIEVGGSF